jgi:hypothetical protein
LHQAWAVNLRAHSSLLVALLVGACAGDDEERFTIGQADYLVPVSQG